MTGAADTIAAVATPPGRGAIGIVRISGAKTPEIASPLLAGGLPEPRHARLTRFLDARGRVLDSGLTIFMPGPDSFTGEDVLELHGHGGAIVLDLLLSRIIELGARPARPGEFSERAYLNGKLDLTQAEAIADIIDADSASAARAAQRSLAGEFSRQVYALAERIAGIRARVEAAIDFADEDLDTGAAAAIAADVRAIAAAVRTLRAGTRTGVVLREGLDVVVAGAPNVGKSSLLNRLCGREAAIVTNIPGTTRDALTVPVQVTGLAITVTDTAGLHTTEDPVEREGIARARAAMERADLVLWVHDIRDREDACELPAASNASVLRILNKVDLTDRAAGWRGERLAISATSGAGLAELTAYIGRFALGGASTEGLFSARRRHLKAIDDTLELLNAAAGQTDELLAEHLRLAHNALAGITGEFTTEDLLGRIFSEFCIGK